MPHSSQRNRHWNQTRDINEPEIIDEFEANGCKVVQLVPFKRNVKTPDLLVGYAGRWFLVEVKQEGGKLTDKQAAFQYECVSHSLPCFMIDHIDDVKPTLKQVQQWNCI